MNAHWCLAAELEPTKRLNAASLVYEAAPEFLKIFSSSKVQLVEALAHQFSLTDSELAPTQALLIGESVAAIQCGYDAASLRDRQATSLRELLRVFPPTPEMIAGLGAYRKRVAPAPERGAYLARITVAAEQRGTGLVLEVLKKTEESLSNVGLDGPFWLHVAANNAVARRVWEKNGYRTMPGTEGFDFPLMQKPR